MYLMLYFSQYCMTAKRSLVLWYIHALNVPNITFHGFYHVEGTICKYMDLENSHNRELHTTYVGRSKDVINLVYGDEP